MKTRKLPLDFARPANPVPHKRGRNLMREMVLALEKKFGEKASK